MKYTAFRLLGRISHVRDMCTISNIFYVRRVAVLVVRAIYGGRVIMAARCGRDLFERRGRFAVAHLGGSRDILGQQAQEEGSRTVGSCGSRVAAQRVNTRSAHDRMGMRICEEEDKKETQHDTRALPSSRYSVPAESRELRGGEVVCCGVMHPDRAASLPDHLTLSAHVSFLFLINLLV